MRCWKKDDFKTPWQQTLRNKGLWDKIYGVADDNWALASPRYCVADIDRVVLDQAVVNWWAYEVQTVGLFHWKLAHNMNSYHSWPWNRWSKWSQLPVHQFLGTTKVTVGAVLPFNYNHDHDQHHSLTLILNFQLSRRRIVFGRIEYPSSFRMIWGPDL